MSYYSGQGRLYLAERTSAGRPKGFTPIGNVPALEISIETTKFEHKESMSGQRAVDYSLIQEKKGTFTMTMEDLTLANLSVAFWGAETAQVAGAFSNLELVAYVKATGSDATGDTRILLVDPATNVTYTDVDTLVIGGESADVTPYEFGTARGTTASPGGALNGYVDLANGVVVIFSTAEQTARSAAENIADAGALFIVSGNYGATSLMTAFTETSMERWLRFEGLNTAISDGTKNNVIIDIFKASIDPLQGYGLINEELASIELNGSVLYDDTQPGTAKYFKQVNVTG